MLTTMLVHPPCLSVRARSRLHQAGKSTHGAFSLIELLAVIVVIAILASILVGVISHVRKQVDQVNGVGKLRHLMSAVMIYASENQGRVPGPAARAQYAVLRKSEAQLPWLLRDYLDIPADMEAGTPLSAIMPPRLHALYNPNNTAAYFAVNNIHVQPRPIKPWGTPDFDIKDWTTDDDIRPKRLDEIPDLSRYVALVDLDQQLQVAYYNVMVEPLYGDSRNAAYWDGHVEIVPLDYDISPDRY